MPLHQLLALRLAVGLWILIPAAGVRIPEGQPIMYQAPALRYWPIYEKLFCLDGMRVPVLFCGEGSIGTTCESRKKWLSVHKIPFRVLSSQRRCWIAWLVAIRWSGIFTHKALRTSYKKASKWFKAATRNGQIFVFWSSGYDPLPSFGYVFTFPYTCHSPINTIDPKLTMDVYF